MISGFVGTEIEELFSEILFGVNGGWIGFIIIASIMLLVTAKVKLAAIPFMVVSVFLGILMSGQLATSNNLWWVCILYFIFPFFLFLLMIQNKKGGF